MSDFLTDADLATRLGGGVTEQQVGIWRRSYGWPHFKVGRQVRYTAEQVAEIVAMQTRRPKVSPIKAPGQTKASASRRRAS